MATKNVQPPTPPCSVLSHPAFDRPAVLNLRGPGRKKGAVSLATPRRNRSLAQARAEMQARAEEQARDLAHVLSRPTPESGAKGLPPSVPSAAGLGMAPGEAAVIAAAVAILDARLRVPGMVLDTPFLVKALLRLHLAERESEAFAVLFIDAQTRLIAFEVMFVGGLTQTSVHPREIVRRALEHNAAAVVFSHNHPSGTAEPSRADEYLTQTLKAALALIDVRVLDHVVIGGADAVSFAERGLL